MDFFGSTRLLEWLANKRKESYTNSPAAYVLPELSVPGPSPEKAFAVFSFGGIVSFIIGVLIGLIAIYLSWTCNTSLQYGTLLKVVFAFFAYIFGLLYIILYIIMRYDTCAYIKKNNYY